MSQNDENNTALASAQSKLDRLYERLERYTVYRDPRAAKVAEQIEKLQVIEDNYLKLAQIEAGLMIASRRWAEQIGKHPILEEEYVDEAELLARGIQ
jgi:hypothetical protein